MKKAALFCLLFATFSVFTSKAQTCNYASPYLEVNGPLLARQYISTVNKAGTGWVLWANRDTETPEATMSLSNINNMNANYVRATNYLLSYGPLLTKGTLYTNDKADVNWIPWATRNTSTTETTIDLSNINNVFVQGRVGIGTTSLQHLLNVAGTMNAKGVVVNADASSQPINAMTLSVGSFGTLANSINSYYFKTIDAGSGVTPFIIRGDGNIGIGTSTPNYKLDVAGTIHAKEVIVNLTGFPDYVFEKNYNLLKLQDVDKYIQTNGHLPNIPSAKEVEKNGLNMADMQVKLLQKVEELTLYMISQQKEIEGLKKELRTSK